MIAHLSINTSIHLSTCPFVHIYRSIHLYFRRSIYLLSQIYIYTQLWCSTSPALRLTSLIKRFSSLCARSHPEKVIGSLREKRQAGDVIFEVTTTGLVKWRNYSLNMLKPLLLHVSTSLSLYIYIHIYIYTYIYMCSHCMEAL